MRTAYSEKKLEQLEVSLLTGYFQNMILNGTMFQIWTFQMRITKVRERNSVLMPEMADDDIEESPPTDVCLLFTDGKDPTGDGLYPAVTTEFSQTARETLEENVETNDPYVVDVKFDIADVE